MQKLKVKFLDKVGYESPHKDIIAPILQKHFDLEFSEEPDFLFCTVWAYFDNLAFLQYDCPRIMWSNEDLFPDFNFFDYWIGFDPIKFEHSSPYNNKNHNMRVERFFQYSLDLASISNKERFKTLFNRQPFTKEDLKKKSEFCALISGHESQTGKRAQLFNLLSHYKQVISAGSYLNNMPNGKIVSRTEKLEFLTNFKFSIACESPAIDGFITEKLPEAFTSTIPIYFGTNYVERYYNKNAFINLHDFETIEEAVDKIIEIDSNDELYCKMMSEPVFNNVKEVEKKRQEFEDWLIAVVSQDKDDVYKRPSICYQNGVLRKNYAIFGQIEDEIKSMRNLANNKVIIKAKQFKYFVRNIFRKK